MAQTETIDKPATALQTIGGFLRANIGRVVPVAGLVAVVVIMAIATDGLSLSPTNLKVLLNQFVVLAIVSTGATFIFSMGGFDVSLGAVVCVASAVGASAANASGSVSVMLLACVGTAVGVSLLNGAIIAVSKLPSFLVTLAAYLILISVASLILGDKNTVPIEIDLRSLDTPAVKAGALIVVIALSAVVFNYMRLGRSNRLIGGSQTVAKFTGMSISRNTMLSFLISGIALGIGSFLVMTRAGAVSYQTGQAYGFDIIIAIVLGGMPISGGARSRITAALVGALTLNVFNNGLVILGAKVGALQAARGALFLVVVALLMARHRTKLLDR